jgi:hypothetical protein
MTVLGGVLAMLALFAGFALTDASRTHLARLDSAARGMLVDGERLDNRQYLVWAAVRRAGELEKLRQLPDTPMIVAPPTPAEIVPVAPEPSAAPSGPAPAVATLPAKPDAVVPDDATGSIVTPDAPLQVDIGEASSTELPLTEKEPSPPVQGPESLRPLDQSRDAEPTATPAAPVANMPAPPDDTSAAAKAADTGPADIAPADTKPAEPNSAAGATGTNDESAGKIVTGTIPLPPLKVAAAPAVKKTATVPRKHRRRVRARPAVADQPAANTTRAAEPPNPFAALFGSPSPAAGQPH